MRSEDVRYVADAGCLLALFLNEPGGEEVRNLLENRQAKVFCHCVNMCEVFYAVLRAAGHSIALAATSTLVADGLILVENTPQTQWQDAGRLKVNPGGISIADCFAIALARAHDCELLTTDHHEMDRLVGTGIVKLKFVR